MPNLLPGIIRTAVPVIVGYLLSIPLVVQLENVANVPQGDRNAWLARGVTAAITVLYYVVVRFLEAHKSWFGWLLGLAQQPTYPTALAAVPAAPAVMANDGPDNASDL